MSQVPDIDINQSKEKIKNGAILVDVREQNEYDDQHIPGSILIPLSEFAERFEELPKDKPLVMQCRSGARSARAGEHLLANGYTDVVNMAGGILAWAEAGLETE